MTKNKINRIKNERIESEEQIEIKRFIIILLILVIFVVGIYFFTRIFVTKDLFGNKDENNNTPISGTVDYDTTLIGAMLSKPEEEYYVLAYKSEDITSDVYYGGLVTNYRKSTKALKVYTADLSNELNKKYYDNKNVNTSSLETLKLGDVTLLKISKGKIVAVYTKEEDITKQLKYVSDAK